jgi:hypothetical protein
MIYNGRRLSAVAEADVVTGAKLQEITGMKLQTPA